MYRRAVLLCLVAVIGTAAACSAQSAEVSETSGADLQAEAAKANDLLQRQNFAGALPLYEDLHKKQPENLNYQERLAVSLIAGASHQSGDEAKATLQRARKLLLQAQTAGDNSNLVQILLEHLDPAIEAKAPPPQPGQEWIDRGERAFTSGDLDLALDDYSKALDENPKLYAAALFAGDTEFKLGHAAEAGEWFARAIAIDPDVETAYRYWGDTLEKAGDPQRAEEEFIKAVVAEPYVKSPRIGLQQWAQANHARLMAPPIRLPAGVKIDQPNGTGKTTVTLTVPSGDLQSTPETSVALAYSMQSALWHGAKFHQQFPNEHEYRHSLAEEASGIRTMLEAAKDQKLPEGQLNTSVSLLQELDNKGLLECWILLEDADAGIAQDYAAFRQAHRALLERYIAEYEIHPM